MSYLPYDQLHTTSRVSGKYTIRHEATQYERRVAGVYH